MAIRKIVEIGDEKLRKQCKTVEKFDLRLRILLKDMADTMYKANGVGLAAPQVGVLRRIVVIDVGDGLLELINPEIIETEGEKVGVEGCLSVPGRRCTVKRPTRVVVRAKDRRGREIEVEGTGLLATCLCHEIDHLDGVLYIDKMIADVSDKYDLQEAE